MQAAQKGEQTDVPEPLMRRYLEEDRMADALRSVAMADAELIQLSARDGASSVWMTERLQKSKERNHPSRRCAYFKRPTKQSRPTCKVKSLVANQQTEISWTWKLKCSIEQEMGKMEETKRQVRREKRIRSGEVVWEYQGEYWADEVGYYRLNTKSDCPASLYKD